MSKQARQDLGAYLRSRPTSFYDGYFTNGSFTLDVKGCNWTCESCWSGYGWRNMAESKPQLGDLTSSQVVDRLLAGMERNAQPMARISGGEASMYWQPHMQLVIREFIDRTRGKRMVVDGATGPHGDPLVLMIETHGGLLGRADLQELDDEYGEDASRIVMAIGMKATNPTLLKKLTGMSDATCERFHDRQMSNLKWLALESEHLGWFGNFLEPFTDPDEFAVLQRQFERRRVGAGVQIGVAPFHRGRYGTNQAYTPKRHRTDRPTDG